MCLDPREVKSVVCVSGRFVYDAPSRIEPIQGLLIGERDTMKNRRTLREWSWRRLRGEVNHGA